LPKILIIRAAARALDGFDMGSSSATDISDNVRGKFASSGVSARMTALRRCSRSGAFGSDFGCETFRVRPAEGHGCEGSHKKFDGIRESKQAPFTKSRQFSDQLKFIFENFVNLNVFR
jgi:hypothetical protein